MLKFVHVGFWSLAFTYVISVEIVVFIIIKFILPLIVALRNLFFLQELQIKHRGTWVWIIWLPLIVFIFLQRLRISIWRPWFLRTRRFLKVKHIIIIRGSIFFLLFPFHLFDPFFLSLFIFSIFDLVPFKHKKLVLLVLLAFFNCFSDRVYPLLLLTRIIYLEIVIRQLKIFLFPVYTLDSLSFKPCIWAEYDLKHQRRLRKHFLLPFQVIMCDWPNYSHILECNS